MSFHRTLTIGTIAALATGACALGDVVTVHVFDFDYSINPFGQPVIDPTIRVGDTIRWVFDTSDHSATSVLGIAEQWDSGIVDPGGTFDHTFTHAGSFEYYCLIHGFDAGNGHAGGMAGVITVVGCYPNCDGSTTAPALNVLDFSCFLNKFAAGDSYANCDQSTTAPILNVLDFSCFLNKFAAGCP